MVLAVDPFKKLETLHTKEPKRTVKGDDDVFVIYPLIIDVIPQHNIAIRDAAELLFIAIFGLCHTTFWCFNLSTSELCAASEKCHFLPFTFSTETEKLSSSIVVKGFQ